MLTANALKCPLAYTKKLNYRFFPSRDAFFSTCCKIIFWINSIYLELAKCWYFVSHLQAI